MTLTRSQYKTALTLAGIIVVAFGIRLTWTLWTAPIPPALSDPEYYNATALSLARDFRYAVLFDGERGFFPGGESTAFWPPGYSAFLALWYWLFGEEVAVGRLANVVAGALTVVPIYFIGLRLFDRRVGLIGAAIAALLPSFVFWTPVLMSETLFTLVFASAFALLLNSVSDTGRMRPGLVIAFGLTLAMATFVRGQAVVLLPLACLWWWLCGVQGRTLLAGAAASAVIVAALLAPWSVRNAAEMDSPVLLSGNMGYNLRIGHAPYSDGRYLLPQDLWDDRPGISFREREALFNDVGAERARAYALHHPLDEIELTGRKVMWLWRPDSDALIWVSTFGATPLPSGAWEPLRVLLDASYIAVLLLASCAAFVARYRTSVLFVGVLVAGWTAVHIVFFGEPRYHLPVLAVLVPTAAAGGVGLIERLMSLRLRRDPSVYPPPLTSG